MADHLCDPDKQEFLKAMLVAIAFCDGPPAVMAMRERIAAFDRLTESGWKYDLVREEFVRPYFDDPVLWGEVSQLIGQRWQMYRTNDMDVHLIPPGTALAK